MWMRWFFYILVSVLLAGCGSSYSCAPVVNGWLQPHAAQSFYRVHQGDTIYSIAWAFGLDYRALAAANHLQPPYAIHAGQKLLMTNVPRGEYHPPAQRKNKSHRYVKQTTKKFPVHHQQSQLMLYNWIWPAKGRVISDFHLGRSGNKGIDIVGHYGEPILATQSGEVVYSGAGIRGYGNLIIIKHNDNYLSAYAYNKDILVQQGSWVRKGQQIASMGKNFAGQAMLHFEIRRNGKPVNPLNYLKRS